MHYLPLNERKLTDLITQCRHLNIFPVYLPEYVHADRHPVGAILGQLVDEAVECLSAMKQDEVAQLIHSIPPGISMMLDRDASDPERAQKERLAVCCIIAEVQQNRLSFKDLLSAQPGESLVLTQYPELVHRTDKDGLLFVDKEFDLLPGGIGYRDHILHYHQFLRRGYTSNPNFDFTGTFIRYCQTSCGTNTFRIAIDHRRLMPKDCYQRIIEMDTWYGAPFDVSKLDDPNAIGLTVVKRNKDSLFEMPNHLDRTEFYWSHREGIKTFEIEEVSDIDYRFEHYNFNRYVHSERDTAQAIFRHLDGAVKVYIGDQYSERFNTRMPDEWKSHRKVKLYRIDGVIDLESWTDLISFFFKSNEMIIEYFSPDQFEELFEERVRDFRKWKQKQRG